MPSALRGRRHAGAGADSSVAGLRCHTRLQCSPRARFRYLVQVRGDDLYAQLVTRSQDAAVQEIAINYEQQLIERGRGEGREEGAMRLLLKLVRLKFGEIGEEHAQRLSTASASELERWSEAILTAETLDELLG